MNISYFFLKILLQIYQIISHHFLSSIILILQLYECPHFSVSSLIMWVCVCVNWQRELGKQSTHQDHTNRTSCICTLKINGHRKKQQQQWSRNCQANTYAIANTQPDLSFGMSFVFALAWPLSFTDIKCQAFSIDSQDEEERLPYVRETQAHKYKNTALSGTTGIL